MCSDELCMFIREESFTTDLQAKVSLRANSPPEPVLYASVVSQICKVFQPGNLWSETLSSTISVTQTSLAGGAWDRELIPLICYNRKRNSSSRAEAEMSCDELVRTTVWKQRLTCSHLVHVNKHYALRITREMHMTGLLSFLEWKKCSQWLKAARADCSIKGHFMLFCCQVSNGIVSLIQILPFRNLDSASKWSLNGCSSLARQFFQFVYRLCHTVSLKVWQTD